MRGEVYGWVLGAGMGTGWVGGRGNTRYPPAPREDHPRQRSGPRTALQGWEWVVWDGDACPGYHPAGPVGQPAALPVPRTRSQVPHNAVQTAKTSENSHISVKLVKTAECHQEMSIRPVIVPIPKNGLRNSPLGFLRIPFSPAFSPKELMVPICA